MSSSDFRNADVSYLIGAFQSDGYFYIFNDKKRNKICKRFGISGINPSLPMIKQVQKIFKEEFDRHVKIQYYKTRKLYYFITSINNLLPLFISLGILPKRQFPPKWIRENPKFFGMYLSGLIDGDGSICIKRPEYPQCRIRICYGKIPTKLSKLIERVLNCSTTITHTTTHTNIKGREINGTGYNLDFYVSPKNMSFVKRYIYPYIQIEHKRKKLEDFFKLKENN